MSVGRVWDERAGFKEEEQKGRETGGGNISRIL